MHGSDQTLCRKLNDVAPNLQLSVKPTVHETALLGTNGQALHNVDYALIVSQNATKQAHEGNTRLAAPINRIASYARCAFDEAVLRKAR